MRQTRLFLYPGLTLAFGGLVAPLGLVPGDLYGGVELAFTR